jgi:hypothetical protein
MRARCLLPVLLALALAPVGARAESHSPRADALFREGRAAAQAGDFQTAYAKFDESERIEPAPGTLLNLADCEEHLGKLLAAREHFDLAASAFPVRDARHAFAARRAALLEERIPRITLRLAAGAPAGTTVRIGANVLDPTALARPVRVDPGTVTVVVTAPGRADRTYAWTVGERDHLDESIEPGGAPDAAGAVQPSPPPSPTQPPTPAPATVPASADVTPGGTRTLGFVLGGAGLAAIGVGTVTGLLALDRASTVKSHCDATDACDAQGLDAASQGKWLAPTSTIAFIAGGVLVAAGAYFVFWHDRGRDVAWAPWVEPGGGGAAMSGRF